MEGGCRRIGTELTVDFFHVLKTDRPDPIPCAASPVFGIGSEGFEFDQLTRGNEVGFELAGVNVVLQKVIGDVEVVGGCAWADIAFVVY